MTEPDFIAAIDQRRAEVENLAGLFGAYFKGLISNGFEREEAMSLVSEYQAELFDNGREAESA